MKPRGCHPRATNYSLSSELRLQAQRATSPLTQRAKCRKSRDLRTTEQPPAQQSTVKTLNGGVIPHRLTDEDRARAVEKRRQKAEQAKAAKLEALLPKAWRTFEKALSQESADARALDAAKFVWEQEHGRATQRVETTDVSSNNPFDKLSAEEQEAVIQAVRAKLAAVPREDAA